MFNYDWFHGAAFQQQCDEARMRCALKRFKDADRATVEQDEAFQGFLSELEVRTLIYLRDGFSYEMRDIADLDSKSHLTFECEPVEEQYKVGAFIVTVPFEELVRVEVFAVHPSEKPGDMPQITGFRGTPDRGDRAERGDREPRG
ncbi:MAG: hypothetical protein KJ057_07425 [Phycisphaerae bacterium]|nr:MAG: hypothetical protein EDS66_04430 [Planctomycetota bacterium]KAB2942738.1 MAG: hypothetical protein F9K17_12155 [Phycisphaerae bacterium]MBE7457021.1 hypothetical protein [Planctomycetia bacterium]MCL4718289.1 hypothetical protein [Phycisphaerae bacterium]MCQ3920406.1 hypothetical protein [Planctomycetota bacterium]